jgi:hypothetical protein
MMPPLVRYAPTIAEGSPKAIVRAERLTKSLWADQQQRTAFDA